MTTINEFNPAPTRDVIAAIMAYIDTRPETPAVEAARDFARSRLPEVLQRQLAADEESFVSGWQNLTLYRGRPKTGTESATKASDGFHVWRVSSGGGSERHVTEVDNEAYGRRYIDWLNTHPNNRRSTSPEARINDRFELRRGTLTIYAPPLPLYTDVRSWRERDEPFPG